VFTHGGKLTGNCCQTIARDILAPSLTVAEQEGYLPILSVHDEALTEVPDTDEFNAEGLVKIMSTNPVWAPDLPLAAAGFETYCYKKD
jgi:DNA polymerase